MITAWLFWRLGESHMIIGRCLRKDRGGVSPLIATIVLVSVSIVMSISVAYWRLGLDSAFTRFEALEFTDAYVLKQDGVFEVKMEIKNMGTTSLTVDQVLLNGKPVEAYEDNGSRTVTITWASITLEPNQQTEGSIFLVAGIQWGSGMSVEVVIHTHAGEDYPKRVTLPQ